MALRERIRERLESEGIYSADLDGATDRMLVALRLPNLEDVDQALACSDGGCSKCLRRVVEQLAASLRAEAG